MSKPQHIFNIFVFEFALWFSLHIMLLLSGITTFPGIWIVWGGMSMSLAVSATFGFDRINPAVTFACMIKS